MKKRVLLILSLLLVLAVTIVAMAYNHQPAGVFARAACCCCSDSCPMKTDKGSADMTSCCDRDDCCSKRGSCPMRRNAEHIAVQSEPPFSADNKCDCPCCADKKNG